MTRRARITGGLLLFAVCLLAAAPLVAAELTVDPDRSVIAVITHKTGFAKGAAHNHLIAVGAPLPPLHLDPEHPEATSFDLRFRAEDLEVDRRDLEETWYPRIADLGVLDEPFSEKSGKDRDKVRKTMLGEKQLAAEEYPEIAASVVRVESARDDPAFPFRATVALEVHGKRVEAPFRARYETDGATLSLEAIGEYNFTDFGIEPYSAFLGAVGNEDRFHVYLRLVADRADGETPAASAPAPAAPEEPEEPEPPSGRR